MRRNVVGLCLLLIAAPAAWARWTPRNYPNPMRDVETCGRRGVTSWVCDPDGVISYESANVVEGLIKKIHAGLPPFSLGPCGRAGPQGFQVAVALMFRMKKDGHPDIESATKAMATGLHDRWGVGDRRCDNGVLLLVSRSDRQLYISTGAGATQLLTYDVLGDILEDVRPLLRKGSYDDAIERAVMDIGLALAGRRVEPQPDRGNSFSKDDGIALGVFALAAGAMFSAAFWNDRRRRRRYNDCRSKLEKLKRDQAALRAGSYNPTSCPVCLEDFTPEPGAAGSGAAAAGGSEAAAGAAAAPEQQRRPLVLPCGHAFCEPCISKWLDQKKVTCPICRRPIDEEDSPTDTSAPRQPPPSQRPGGAGGPSGSGSGSGAGPSRPPCTVDDEYDDATAAGAAAAAAQPHAGWGMGGGGGGLFGTGWGVNMGGVHVGVGSPYGSHYSYGTYGPRLRLRWGGRRRAHVRMHEDMLMAEMLFRLRQLQRQHPDYISTGMLNSWEEDMRMGREFSASQLRDFQLRDPANRSNLAHSGRSGTGIRFGGGSSRGGGGRGGSW
ncbi:hypothetical protein GPECTOR_413g260 [Gonium pectorale]|uniref:RING-type domain-containing protein n=1 Tax=Gonium pectorale TaxID=33097 RepID=A0A150FV99_GONPE|nr:hypothetical protein GPECTOR_413g260 [Gonium pectorale]|eukprot:KXZ41529.1 hypothetical protein GPECTOR_413g260 [Gonium pectorale]